MLFLYMQNNGSLHASALFSDATTQDLIAPNSNLLRDSLQSVGVNVNELQIPPLTKGIIVAEYDSIVDGIAGLRLREEIGLQQRIMLRRSETVKKLGLPDATENLLPIEVVSRESDAGTSTDFDLNLYFNQLQSKIGQVISVHKSSRLSQHLPVVQHIFCVAIVEAARNLSGYPDFPLRIKWPNDLYYDRSHKVGGMLLQCKTRDDSYLVSIGCGMNVSNEKPTICLNDMLPKEAETRITREQLIAETMNRFTYYMLDYKNQGPENFRRKYYEYWLHSQQEVLLSDFDERVTIRGSDDDGYLQVRSKSSPDKIFSIGDDGNTFDMMKGLIRHKY